MIHEHYAFAPSNSTPCITSRENVVCSSVAGLHCLRLFTGTVTSSGLAELLAGHLLLKTVRTRFMVKAGSKEAMSALTRSAAETYLAPCSARGSADQNFDC